jgi:hypothetical protein
MTTWQKPEFIELCMNAEIGAYQEDTGNERDQPILLAPTPANRGLSRPAEEKSNGCERVA